MCGRFTQQMSWSELHDLYSVYTVPQNSALLARYNGAPTQEFAACRIDESGNREISVLRWGLVPFWAKDVSIASRLINARAESVHSKPSFRTAFRKRRCLVPANGWFEWSSVAGRKQPYFIKSESDRSSFYSRTLGVLGQGWRTARDLHLDHDSSDEHSFENSSPATGNR